MPVPEPENWALSVKMYDSLPTMLTITPEPVSSPCGPFTVTPTTLGSTSSSTEVRLLATEVRGTGTSGAWREDVTSGALDGTTPAANSTPAVTSAPKHPAAAPTKEVLVPGERAQSATRYGSGAPPTGLAPTSEGCLHNRSSGGGQGLAPPATSAGSSGSSSSGPIVVDRGYIAAGPGGWRPWGAKARTGRARHKRWPVGLGLPGGPGPPFQHRLRLQ